MGRTWAVHEGARFLQAQSLSESEKRLKPEILLARAGLIMWILPVFSTNRGCGSGRPSSEQSDGFARCEQTGNPRTTLACAGAAADPRLPD